MTKEEKEKFLEIINKYWGTMPHILKPRIRNFNQEFPVYDNIEELIKLEKLHPELGIGEEGFTMLAFIASVTDLLVGERLAATTEDGKIIGWEFYKRD